jgi:hypothetical protein
MNHSQQKNPLWNLMGLLSMPLRKSEMVVSAAMN